MLAAATGVVAATVIMMGLLSLPAMVRYGYDHRLATGVIAASGTLAQLIPPSLVLIVLASTTRGVSVGGLFRGAIVPGLMLVGALRAVRRLRRPALPREGAGVADRGAPGLPRAGRSCGSRSIAIVPPIVLIFCVLGAIFQGSPHRARSAPSARWSPPCWH